MSNENTSAIKEPLLQSSSENNIKNDQNNYTEIPVNSVNTETVSTIPNNLINNRKVLTSPKFEVKIPDTLTNNPEYKINKEKPENKETLTKVEIPTYSPTNEAPTTSKSKVHPVGLSDQHDMNTNINIPEANQNQVNPLQNNSSTLEYLDNLKKALRTQSSALKCPFCLKQVETDVTKTCSVINILCAIITTPIFWALLKCCRGKDCNCYDAKHVCKRCRKEIADYSAC